MADSVSQAQLALDFSHLNKLKAQARVDRKQAAGQAAREFETLFIGQMLKTMRNSLPKDGLFSSADMRLYQGWFDQQIARELGQRGALGLAATIEKQLMGPEKARHGKPPTALSTADWLQRQAITPDQKNSDHKADEVTSQGMQVHGSKVKREATESAAWRSGPKAFVRALLPHAKQAAAMLGGVHPGLLLAQAALETGWGRHLPGDGQGEGLNLFGIKADSRWSGPRVTSQTQEYRQGRMQRESADFRAFDDLSAAFQGLVDFLRGNPRYQPALAQANSPEGWARGLQQAGYATDPDYADKLLDIFNRSDFQQWLQQAEPALKFFDQRPISTGKPSL